MAEIKATHPEARDLEVWFLDEARVGQTGRTCRRWFEKGIRPRGRRDLRHAAVYLFGAVCPGRAARHSCGRHFGPRRLAYRQRADNPGQHHPGLPAALLPRAQWHRAGLALPARALLLAPHLADLRCHPRRLLCRVDKASQRTRPHPLALLLRLAHAGHYLTGLVLETIYYVPRGLEVTWIPAPP